MQTQRYRLKTLRVSILCDAVGELAEAPCLAASIARGIYQKLDPDQEHFVVLALNARGRVNGFRVISTGTLSASLVHAREVFRAACGLGAASIILVHNHPSGDPAPSPDDILLTERLEQCGELFGIPVVDHIVLGAEDFRSIGRGVR